MYLLLGEYHKIHRNWLTKDLCCFFFGLHLLFGRKNRSNLSEDLLFFFGKHHEIHRKTLVWEEDYLRLNFGPRNFWNSKFDPRLKKVGHPWIRPSQQTDSLTPARNKGWIFKSITMHQQLGSRTTNLSIITPTLYPWTSFLLNGFKGKSPICQQIHFEMFYIWWRNTANAF